MNPGASKRPLLGDALYRLLWTRAASAYSNSRPLLEIEVTATGRSDAKRTVAFSKRELVQRAASDRETAGAVERTIPQSTLLRADVAIQWSGLYWLSRSLP